MEINQKNSLSKKRKYVAVSIAALMTTFLLIEPMFASYSTSANAIPAHDNCTLLPDQPEDNIAMYSARHLTIVKTVHAEKGPMYSTRE